MQEYAVFTHKAQEDLVCDVTHNDLPHFNAPIYLENKEKVKNFVYLLCQISFFIVFPALPDIGMFLKMWSAYAKGAINW